AVDAGVLQDLLHDVDRVLALEDARSLAVLEYGEGRAEAEAEEELVALVRDEGRAVGQAVVVAEAALRVVDLEQRAALEAVVDAEARVGGRYLDGDRVRKRDGFLRAVRVHLDVGGELVAVQGEVLGHVSTLHAARSAINPGGRRE